MNTVPILVFILDGQQYALPSASVAAVCRMVRVTALPKAPRIVHGVINFRGSLVPVLDLRGRFGLTARHLAHTDYLVIARAGGRLAAIPVQQVPELIAIKEKEIHQLQYVISGTAYVAGVGKLPDGLVLLHDLAKFLTQAEAEDLSEAVADYA